MKLSLQTPRKLIFALLAFSTFIATASPYQTGDKIKSFSAKDQHEADFTLDTANTRFLLVSLDMETGKKANGVLTTKGAEYLPGKKAIYLANIYGMPGIGRFFALPKMKKYTHRIILGDDEKLMTDFPTQEGKVTVIKIVDGKVSAISYWDPASQNIDDVLK